MSKIKPTLVVEKLTTLTQPWFRNVVEPYITLEYYNSDNTYDKQSTIFCANYNARAPAYRNHFIDNGYKIVYDNFQEAVIIDNSKYILQNPNWFRYYESLWYKHLGYDTYQPLRQYKNLALMPLGKRKSHRDLTESKLKPWLDDFVWSYVSKGQRLPDDDVTSVDPQRYFNANWYDQTCFSFVAESMVAPLVNNTVFITEKTYKPIAFRHPFVIMGQQGILKSLRHQGFETFENLFDESYDTEPVWMKRLDHLVSIVQQFNKQPYDILTEQKLKYNHELFFDIPLVTKHIVEEIIYPLLNYAET